MLGEFLSLGQKKSPKVLKEEVFLLLIMYDGTFLVSSDDTHAEMTGSRFSDCGEKS